MKIVRLILPLLALTVIPHSLYAVCHCITPSGSGNQSGADWNNAAAWNGVGFPFSSATGPCTSASPCPVTVGDTYYIAGGDYSATAGTSIDTSNAAVTTFITKATAGAHCTDTGYNDGTMGVPVATWVLDNTIPGAYLTFPSGGFNLNGVTGDGTPATTGQYGFYFNYTGDVTIPVKARIILVGSLASAIDVQNMQISHYEINGGNAMAPPYASGQGAAVPVVVAAGSGHKVGGVTLSYFYQHDLIFAFNGFNVTGSGGITFHHCWYARNRFGAVHSEGPEFKSLPNPGESADNVDIHDCVFEDIEGTGTIVALWGHGDTWNIYNNIFFNTGQPIQLATISRVGGVVTATTQTPVPQGAGASQWLTTSWFKVAYGAVPATLICASSDPSSPTFDCFNGTFQPATISADGKTLTWNQALCQIYPPPPGHNRGDFTTCTDETGTANKSDIALHGQHGVTYVVGENGGGLSNVNFANNTISDVPGLTGMGCKTYTSGFASICNMQNNVWWTSTDPNVATHPGIAGYPAAHINPPRVDTATPCTGVGTPDPACPSGSGSLNGSYSWELTASPAGNFGGGSETSASAAVAGAPVNQQVFLHWSSSYTKWYNVYRTLAGGSTYYLVAQYTNTTFPVQDVTEYVDNVSDAVLSASPCAATPAPPCGPLSPPATNTTPGLGTHDYNSLLNTEYGNKSSVTPGPHDYQFSSGIADPFVNDILKDFHLLADTTQSGGFSYLLGTASGNPSGDNLDFGGSARPGPNGWDRGAFQFGAAPPPPPAPPTNLRVVSVQ